MKETLLSWAIARNAAGMSDQQLSDYIFENSNIHINPFEICKWRNGTRFPSNDLQRNALIITFGAQSYGEMLLWQPEQAMSVLFVGTKMGISADTLRLIKLKKKTEMRLMYLMRDAINITGDEYAAIGVAVAFWDSYFSKMHPFLKLKVKFLKEKGE